MCTPSSSSLSATTHYTMSQPLIVAAAVPITFILLLINVWWDRHWRLRNLPTPVCCSIYTLVFEHRSDPRSQAGASLVWGHEKFEFEDDQGSQWRAWFKECGRAFKIKAAWGHPEIVPHPSSIFEPLQYLLTVIASSINIVGRR